MTDNDHRADRPQWERTVVGRDAIVFERPLDPNIARNMPREEFTYVDFTLPQVVSLRVQQLTSRLLDLFD